MLAVSRMLHSWWEVGPRSLACSVRPEQKAKLNCTKQTFVPCLCGKNCVPGYMDETRSIANMATQRRSSNIPLVLVVSLLTPLPLQLALEDYAVPTPPRVVQYHGTMRAGTMIAVVLGCVIVPIGLIGFLILMIRFCMTTWKHRHQSWPAVTSLFPERPRDTRLNDSVKTPSS